MKQQQVSNSQQQQYVKSKSAEEKKLDIKNAEYIARLDQPNHPNT